MSVSRLHKRKNGQWFQKYGAIKLKSYGNNLVSKSL